MFIFLKRSTTLLALFSSCLLLANTVQAEFITMLALTPKTATLTVKVSGFCNANITLRPPQSSTATSAILLSTSESALPLDLETINFLYFDRFVQPFEGKEISFPSFNTANRQLAISTNKGKFAAKGSSSNGDTFNLMSSNSLFNLPNITCKDDRQLVEIMESISSSLELANTTTYKTTGNLSVSGKSDKLKYSARFKSVMTFTVPEACTEIGELSENLSDLASSNYSYRCTKPVSITITMATVSNGTAVTTDRETLYDIFMNALTSGDVEDDEDG